MAWALKFLVDRPRPALELGIEIAQKDGGSGFPSAHVVHTTVFMGLLFYLVSIHIKRAWLRISFQIILAIPILATGASRVYLGAHWPSDVIGGYVLGAIGLLLLIGVYQRIRLRPDVDEREPPSKREKIPFLLADAHDKLGPWLLQITFQMERDERILIHLF